MKMNMRQTYKVWSDIKRRVKDFYHDFYTNSMAQTFCTEHLHRNGVNTREPAQPCQNVHRVLGWCYLTLDDGGCCYELCYCLLPTDMTSYYGKLFLNVACLHKPRRDSTVAEVFGCSCLDFHQTHLQIHYRLKHCKQSC